MTVTICDSSITEGFGVGHVLTLNLKLTLTLNHGHVGIDPREFVQVIELSGPWVRQKLVLHNMRSVLQ